MLRLSLTVISAVIVIIAAVASVARYTDNAFGLVNVTPYEADVNKNGAVNSGDLMLVAQRFGQPVPTATATALPRPTESQLVVFTEKNGPYDATLTYYASDTGSTPLPPNYQISIDTAYYATAQFTLEVVEQSGNGSGQPIPGGPFCVRLVLAAVPVPGSDACVSAPGYETIRSTPFSLPAGEHTYTLEVTNPAWGYSVMSLYAARLLARWTE